jgi:carbon-monoxide dehydrogenase large subunit
MATPFADLLTGLGRYCADIAVPATAELVFVRSTVAHARIALIDASSARAMPGVLAVLTASDLPLVPIHEIQLIPETFAQPPLATGTVRYVGERIAAVVALSLAEAADAAAAVVVEYEALPATVDPAAAAEPSAPPLFPGHGSNVALEWHLGATEASWPAAPVRVSGEVRMPRVATAPMEGLSVLAIPEPDGRLTVWASTQSPHAVLVQIARALDVGWDRLRVRTPHVGGAFGGKSLGGLPDYVVAAAAALRLGRPVRCVEDRAANLITMQGRGMRLRFELYAERDGSLVGLAVDELCDSGAYPSTNSVEPGKTMMMSAGPYRLSEVRFRGRSVVTNLSPTGAYRGPGRSEAAAVLERAMDLLARRLDLDPVELRRRNLLRADELPHDNPGGAHYDESDYPANLDALIERSGYRELRVEQERRRAARAPRLLGIGVATVLDSTAWFVRDEPAAVSVDGSGRVRVTIATPSAGQRHGDALANLVAGVLPVRAEDVDVVEGDTAEIAGSAGTSGSRSMQLAGSAVVRASEVVLGKARSVAAHLLESSEEDIVVDSGRLGVQGVPTSFLAWADVAARAWDPSSLPRGVEPGLDARCVFQQAHPTYTSAAHLSVVELDVETGQVRPLRHLAVTNCGRVVDVAGALGQVIGASAQGVAQALYEEVAYDDGGNPLGASLAEYLVPAAPDQPSFDAHFLETPSVLNPLGAKGVGEVGMVAAPAAVHGAVIDALAHLGVRDIGLPCTPERVWRAVQEARTNG